MYISKSDYNCAKQCVKKLWMKKFEPKLSIINPQIQSRFDIGHMVGKQAQNLFPGGIEIEYNKNTSIMSEQTKKLLDSGMKIIYEAAFIYENLIAVCDIVVVKEDGIEIYEIKSSSEVKPQYKDDIAFQTYVLKKLGYNVKKANIVHINSDYKRNGELDYNKLFVINDLTEISNEKVSEIQKLINSYFEILKTTKPSIDIGTYCFKPYDCDFSSHCWSHLPECSIFDLYSMGQKAFEHYYKGTITFNDISKSKILLTTIQQIQINSKINESPHLNKKNITEFLNSLKYPLYFMDFETYMEAIPSFDGGSPYSQIPFQYSVHYIEAPNSKLKHFEFLAKEGINPKNEFAKHLCNNIPLKGTILAYGAQFEKGVLKKLADELPEYSEHLLKIIENIKDLLYPFKNGYYYLNDMKGSFSLKSVLPAIFPDDPELDYSKLDIKNGNEAMSEFPNLINLPEDEKLSRREALLKYCRLDTLAMVKILEHLNGL